MSKTGSFRFRLRKTGFYTVMCPEPLYPATAGVLRAAVLPTLPAEAQATAEAAESFDIATKAAEDFLRRIKEDLQWVY